MSYRIPKLSAWCSRCIADGALCDDHRGPAGEPVEYTGSDAYEPSAWALEVVGSRYTAGDRAGENDGKPIVYLCTGYDPRQGFWMQNIATGKRTNVSERAIDRTFHRVKFLWGAQELLLRIAELGRMPTAEEAHMIALPIARQSLERLGYIAADGTITDEGRSALDRMREEHPAP